MKIYKIVPCEINIEMHAIITCYNTLFLFFSFVSFPFFCLFFGILFSSSQD